LSFGQLTYRPTFEALLKADQPSRVPAIEALSDLDSSWDRDLSLFFISARSAAFRAATDEGWEPDPDAIPAPAPCALIAARTIDRDVIRIEGDAALPRKSSSLPPRRERGSFFFFGMLSCEYFSDLVVWS